MTFEAHTRGRTASHLPGRVLPISTHPPVAFDVLVDREYAQVRELLKPGKRQRDEARGRIRALLAMESHAADTVDMSEADIDRVERSCYSRGKTSGRGFPAFSWSRRSGFWRRPARDSPVH